MFSKWPAAAGALLLASPAVAAEDPRQVYAVWQVQPAADAPAERTVAKDAPVIRQELLPVALDALSDDARDAAGKLLLAKGQLLFRLHATTGTVDCVLDTAPRGTVARFIDAATARLCLRDGDGDGRFESYFTYSGKVAGLPSVNGKIPKTPHPLPLVAYTAHDVHEAAGLFYVGIDYAGHAPLSGKPRFLFVYGRTGGEHGSLGQAWSGKTFPDSVQLNGAALTILSEGTDGLRIRVDQPLPAGQFGVGQAGSNGFY